MFVCCVCYVLSGRGIWNELITRLEESYRLWCVVVCDLETSRMRRPWPALGRSATVKNTRIFVSFLMVFAPNSLLPHGRHKPPPPSHSSFCFITRIKFGGMYESRRSSICKFLQSLAAPSLSAASQGLQTALCSKWPPCLFRYFISTLLISSVNINSVKTYLLKLIYCKK
jgi:hypothetical protein